MTERNEIKYLLLALINAVYGLLLLANLVQNPSGFAFIASVGGFIALLGLVGFILWIRDTVSSVKGGKETSELTKSWFQIAKGVDILLVIGLLFRAFVMVPYLVEGPSMQPNYHDRQYLLINQLTYKLRSPERGETIIFHFPKDTSQDYIKRIIGLPGETIEIADCRVKINSQIMVEDYLLPNQCTETENGQSSETVTLEQNQYFVMGDNRDQSSDSRSWGVVPKKNIVGRAWYSIYPFSYFGLIRNPQLSFTPTALLLQNKIIAYERIIYLQKIS